MLIPRNFLIKVFSLSLTMHDVEAQWWGSGQPCEFSGCLDELVPAQFWVGRDRPHRLERVQDKIAKSETGPWPPETSILKADKLPRQMFAATPTDMPS
jgi:hypothetical protein